VSEAIGAGDWVAIITCLEPCRVTLSVGGETQGEFASDELSEGKGAVDFVIPAALDSVDVSYKTVGRVEYDFLPLN
jgi:hypothetical protein